MTILAIVLCFLFWGVVLLAVFLVFEYKNMDSIVLVQYRLENSDSVIGDAIPYLKITNEWSE